MRVIMMVIRVVGLIALASMGAGGYASQEAFPIEPWVSSDRYQLVLPGESAYLDSSSRHDFLLLAPLYPSIGIVISDPEAKRYLAFNKHYTSDLSSVGPLVAEYFKNERAQLKVLIYTAKMPEEFYERHYGLLHAPRQDLEVQWRAKGLSEADIREAWHDHAEDCKPTCACKTSVEAQYAVTNAFTNDYLTLNKDVLEKKIRHLRLKQQVEVSTIKHRLAELLHLKPTQIKAYLISFEPHQLDARISLRVSKAGEFANVSLLDSPLSQHIGAVKVLQTVSPEELAAQNKGQMLTWEDGTTRLRRGRLSLQQLNARLQAEDKMQPRLRALVGDYVTTRALYRQAMARQAWEEAEPLESKAHKLEEEFDECQIDITDNWTGAWVQLHAVIGQDSLPFATLEKPAKVNVLLNKLYQLAARQMPREYTALGLEQQKALGITTLALVPRLYNTMPFYHHRPRSGRFEFLTRCMRTLFRGR